MNVPNAKTTLLGTFSSPRIGFSEGGFCTSANHKEIRARQPSTMSIACCLLSNPQTKQNTGNDGLEHASLSTPQAAAGGGRPSGPDAPSSCAASHLRHRRRRRHHTVCRRIPCLLRACHHAASCHNPPGKASHGEGAPSPSRRAVHQKHVHGTVCGTVR